MRTFDDPIMVLKPLVGAIIGIFSLCTLAMPPAEELRVERLLARVKSTESAVFIRNGREYSADNAAEFLRRKCGGRMDDYVSAEQLVRECAAKSSTSGELYRIRLSGAPARPSADVLGEWLR